MEKPFFDMALKVWLMPVDRFIGAALVSNDFRNRAIRVWNGGVPAAVLVHKDGVILHNWLSRNLPVGILGEEEFSSEIEVFHYKHDCQLYLFSDGLLKFRVTRWGRISKQSTFKQLLQNTKPDRRFEMLISSLDHHLRGQPGRDDVSLAVVNISAVNAQAIIYKPVARLAAR